MPSIPAALYQRIMMAQQNENDGYGKKNFTVIEEHAFCQSIDNGKGVLFEWFSYEIVF